MRLVDIAINAARVFAPSSFSGLQQHHTIPTRLSNDDGLGQW